MSNAVWLIVALSAAAVVLWPADSWFVVRLGRASNVPQPELGWVPLVRTVVVARAAGVGWLSWLLSLVPVVGAYVNWDWFDDISWELGLRHSSLRSLGIVLIPGLRTYLLYRTTRAAEARSGVRRRGSAVAARARPLPT